VVEGLESLEDATDDEDDYLDKAWGLKHYSRLSCQAIVNNKDLIVEIPKYTINYASERH
jgi:2Fe-2S ferredoxin